MNELNIIHALTAPQYKILAALRAHGGEIKGIKGLASLAGVSYQTVERNTEDLVRAGFLDARKVRVAGYDIWTYRHKINASDDVFSIGTNPTK